MSPRPNRVVEALADWVPLVEPTGPFLTLPVLKRVFPNGMERVPSPVRAAMRQHLETLAEAGPGDRVAYGAWLRWVLREVLAYGPLLREGSDVPATLVRAVPEHGVTLRPDFVLVAPDERGGPSNSARLLVEVYAPGTDLGQRLPDQRWTATPVERMSMLCRGVGVELGLVTNGNAFTLIWAPQGQATATATWQSGHWSEERGLFDAFVSLLSARRFFAVAPGDTLGAMLAESATAQVEVTNQLGKQVKQAVELLVDAFSRANRDSGGQLIDDLGAGDLETAAEMVYGAAVTVMMRLVFLLCAEERRLFPVGDALYDGSYALSTLLDALHEDASLHGEETLERRTAAWHRILAAFRLVHDGVQHETLRIPAYGGGLFDPERFPFLEGRRPGRAGVGTPPMVSDRSVMAILDALQFLNFKGETRRVSYRSLDVEQIGHVYEGLLDHGCRVVDDLMLGLGGKAEPEVPLADLEAAAARGRDALVARVQELTGRAGAGAIVRELDRPMDAETRRFLLESCENDTAVVARVTPFVHLLRRDLRGLPVVFLPGALCVMQTSDRRDSGTEYTTREWAEEVVRYTLEPLVYAPGPQDDVPLEQWKLRSSVEILALRVCDPAVGSGAILVAACRYLADRLAEAWGAEDALPADAQGDLDALTIAARRAVVDHCLYGVDRNPMAAEMAKLSLWLVTMAKERPFSFLDHAIQSGDSLLGLTSMEQLTTFHIAPERGRELNPDLFGHAAAVKDVVRQAVEKYRAMADIKVVTVRDASEKARLHAEASDLLSGLHWLANAVVEAALYGGTGVDQRLASVTNEAAAVAAALTQAPGKLDAALQALKTRLVSTGAPNRWDRHPLHWPLVFPDVFLRPQGGFDAVVGNPPFLHGQKITGVLGVDYRGYLVEHIAGGRRGSADLVAYFFHRVSQLLSSAGYAGLLATNTIAEGDTREVGLDQLLEKGLTIYRAVRSRPWPGSATLEVALVWLTTASHSAPPVLDGIPAPSGIGPSLTRRARTAGGPRALRANAGKSFRGTIILGMGFTMTPVEAAKLIARDPANADVLYPYLSGDDLLSSPTQAPARWVINFHDWPEDRASRYVECFAQVTRLVRPEREEESDRNAIAERRAKYWWLFASYTKSLYDAIDGMDSVIALSNISKWVTPLRVDSRMIFSNTLVVFAMNDPGELAVLSSALHWCWAVRHGSTLENRVRYSPTDVFETFPMPVVAPGLRAAGVEFERVRKEVMEQQGLGQTALYNRIHDPDEQSPEILVLRELQQRIESEVVSCYGWTDLNPHLSFQETPQGSRYTIASAVRDEILERLLELNHARYAEEVRLGLHEPKGASKRVSSPKKSSAPAKAARAEQTDLLGALSPAAVSPRRKRS